MTLLITLIAAIISTLLWYRKAPQDNMLLSTLCYLYWGASLMWMVDAVFAYKEVQAAYFNPSLEDLINDSFLGISAVTLGLLIWMIHVLIRDPQGNIKKLLLHTRSE